MTVEVVLAKFKEAYNVPFELDAEKTSDRYKFGKTVSICGISVSHDNFDYVIVKLRKPEDPRPFFKHKFHKGLKGQIFLPPIENIEELIVEVAPKEGTTITDSVLVNVQYIDSED